MVTMIDTFSTFAVGYFEIGSWGMDFLIVVRSSLQTLKFFNLNL